MIEKIYLFVLLFCFYAIIKLILKYKKLHESKYVIGASIVLLIATDLWMRAYGIRLQAFVENFRFVITFIPLIIFLFYTHLEKFRHAEEKAKKFIKGAFQQYVAPSIINEILRNPKKLKLGGEKKELTVMFSDIRNFTVLSEKLSPEQLVHFLNEYLTEMTKIILKNKGVVDKYIGDAIMAFWGAPVDEPEHAKLACKTAIEMMKKMSELKKKWKKEEKPDFNIGIGINTGEMVVGNMGSHQRFNYTVMGDNVNIGSRVEGLTKEYGVTTIVSEFTYEKTKKDFVFRELDLVKVKGKNIPIKIYELCKKGTKKEFLDTFADGLRFYRQKQWDSAIQMFNKALQIVPNDKSSILYIQRCQDFQKFPPAEDWNGAYVMRHK